MKFYTQSYELDAVQQRDINSSCLENVTWMGDKKMVDFRKFW